MAERVYEGRSERRNPQPPPQPLRAWKEATQATLDMHVAILRDISDQLGLLIQEQAIGRERTHEHEEHEHKSSEL